jgi:hypothetical protein
MPHASASEPFWTTNVWFGSNDIMELQGAIQERGLVVGDPYVPNPTNVIVVTNAGFVYNFGKTFDNHLFDLIPQFLAVTNTEPSSNFPSAWSETNLAAYIAGRFVNSDGTAGVGLVTNDVWYLTLTWETNLDLCLGSLVYTIQSVTVTNGTSYYHCGWVETDGDRVVNRAGTSSVQLPKEWNWWYGKRGYWERGVFSFSCYGLVFDWADVGGWIAEIRVRPAASNLADGLMLVSQGLTNYSYTSWIIETNDISLAGASTTALATVIYDLGGYPNADYSGPGSVVPGLILTNTAIQTNLDHVGDNASVHLVVPGRLYCRPNLWDLKPPYGPWIDRRALNERYAILQCLRATGASDGQWTGATNYFYVYGNYYYDGHTAEWGWSQLTNSLAAIWATNPPTSSAGAPLAYTQGGNQAPVNWLEGWAWRRNSAWQTARPVTNFGASLSLYLLGDIPPYSSGVFEQTFNANGENLLDGTWTYHSTTNVSAGGDVTFLVVGATTNIPAWMDVPDYVMSYPDWDRLGYSVIGQMYLQRWTFNHATNSL